MRNQVKTTASCDVGTFDSAAETVRRPARDDDRVSSSSQPAQ